MDETIFNRAFYSLLGLVTFLLGTAVATIWSLHWYDFVIFTAGWLVGSAIGFARLKQKGKRNESYRAAMVRAERAEAAARDFAALLYTEIMATQGDYEVEPDSLRDMRAALARHSCFWGESPGELEPSGGTR